MGEKKELHGEKTYPIIYFPRYLVLGSQLMFIEDLLCTRKNALSSASFGLYQNPETLSLFCAESEAQRINLSAKYSKIKVLRCRDQAFNLCARLPPCSRKIT